MGKYMKKLTTKSVHASMEIPISSTGVRTRAKTLALQKLQNHNKHSAADSSSDPIADESSYLQLRSRRLLKLKPLQQNHNTIAESDSCPNFSSKGYSKSKLGFEKVNKGFDEVKDGVEFGDFEDSFAENDLDFELGRTRASRESTPCNSARGSDCFGTPGSTTRSPLPMSLPHPRIHNSVQQVMPTTSELEEFFAFAEQQQHKLFMDKYNFDVVSERPMPGCYEWVPVKP